MAVDNSDSCENSSRNRRAYQIQSGNAVLVRQKTKHRMVVAGTDGYAIHVLKNSPGKYDLQQIKSLFIETTASCVARFDVANLFLKAVVRVLGKPEI